MYRDACSLPPFAENCNTRRQRVGPKGKDDGIAGSMSRPGGAGRLCRFEIQAMAAIQSENSEFHPWLTPDSRELHPWQAKKAGPKACLMEFPVESPGNLTFNPPG